MTRNSLIILYCFMFLAAGLRPFAHADTSGRIALEVLEPKDRAFIIREYPVSVGLVFPEGDLRSVPGGIVIDDLGNKALFVAKATGWWDAGKSSIKWLLLTFKASTDRKYYFVPNDIPPAISGSLLTRKCPEGDIEVNTGPLVVAFKQGSGNIFDTVSLNGIKMLADTAQPAMVLVKDQAGARTGTKVADWKVAVEEDTPLYATIKATGYMQEPAGATNVAAVQLRYQFFKDESFVKVYHTMLWMVMDPSAGASEWSVGVSPDIRGSGSIAVGLSEYASTAYTNTLDTAGAYYVHQKQADSFQITRDNSEVHSGKFLGGWISLESADGSGMGVSVRDLWQTYPKAFKIQANKLSIEFWPSQGPRMGFQPQDILEEFYHNPVWKAYPWSKDSGHFVDEYAANPYYKYTAEGASRTHELLFFFYDRSSRRRIGELNSINQHPVILRQDPALAMRVPFMGFNIKAVDKEHYPDMEWAIEQLGKITLTRWIEKKSYGEWRFGFLRWDGIDVNYRWMDGLQYDSQLIPWLLFMRGGDRSLYEEGERTARYAMDVHVNHYNTRCYFPGYMSAASCMPFPWNPHHNGKGMKIHYLACYYHLTGYQRAKEVMDMIITNTVASRPKPGHGREIYNMNVFWANAYAETFDPAVKKFARAFLNRTVTKEYNPALKVFRAPSVYLYNGLVFQNELFPDDLAKKTMLENLSATGYPGLEDGGVYVPEYSIACQWGYLQTKNPRFIKIGWDIARNMSDLVPDYNWNSTNTPPSILTGNGIYRSYLMPILMGYSLAASAGYTNPAGYEKQDTFCYLFAGARTGQTDQREKGLVYLKPQKNGDLKVSIIAAGRWGESLSADVTVKAFSGTNSLNTFTIPAAAKPEISDAFYPGNYFTRQRGTFILPEGQKNRLYTLEIETRDTNTPMFLIVANADIVYKLDRYVYFTSLPGQESSGVKIFGRTTQDEVTIYNVHGKPFTMRDAETGELLYRYSVSDDSAGFAKPKIFYLGKGRKIMFTLFGYVDLRGFEGFSPYFSMLRESWFDPTAIVFGNVSGDGKVSAHDAALVALHAAGLITFTDAQKKAADVSGDGKVSMRDAALIWQRAFGLIGKFPNGQ